MNTPICDFVKQYIDSGAARLHVPGHKGVGPLGCEAMDITEIAGADALFEASGIIAESERNAAALFGTAATFYSCEGSSLCIRAMLYLAMANRAPTKGRPVALAARNAHKAFLFAAALCDFDVDWLYPGAAPRTPLAAAPGVPSAALAAAPGVPPAALAAAPGVPPAALAAAYSGPAGRPTNGLPPVYAVDGEGSVSPHSICACPVTPEALAARLDAMAEKPFCVYVTSPDYLGGVQDIAGLSRVCHARGVPLIVDNAHGAYLKFLPESRHPIDLGADMCCDSAHKTLPVLTGGAYLHVSKNADPRYAAGARQAMALFGSTSPSYLILQSLDACNARLAGDWREALAACVQKVAALRQTLARRGIDAVSDEPLKLTLAGDGFGMAGRLRESGVACEYADAGHAVLMFAPGNRDADFERVERALDGPMPGTAAAILPPRLERAMTIRAAVFAPGERVPVDEAKGRVCAAPTVACPPAVPIAVSGEVISAGAVEAFRANGIDRVLVCRETRTK